MLPKFLSPTLLIILIALLTTAPAMSQTRPRSRPSPPQTNDETQGRKLGVSSDTSNPQAEKRVALVIGNGAYATAPLINPPNDARAISAALKEMGFDVIARTNLTMRDMKVAIRDFGDRIQNGGVGLFYFAGHGIQANGKNYLIPVDAQIQKEVDVDIEGIDLGSVMMQMEGARNRLNIVILDACRNNPFARSWRSAARGLAQVNAPSGTFIAYATAPGSVASDGAGQNGLYTSELLKAMRQPGLPIEEVFKQVRVRVKEMSNGNQVPWESSSIDGSFFFIPGKATVAGNNLTNPSGSQPSSSGATSSPVTNPGANSNPVVTPSPAPVVAMRSSVSLEVIERNFQSNLVDEVIKDARAYLAGQPNDPKANWYLGTSLFIRNQHAEGVPYLTRAFEAGMPVSFPVLRHRLFIDDERLENAVLTVQRSGLELKSGKDVVKAPFSQIRAFHLEHGGTRPTPRLHIEIGVQEKDGKIKDKTYNLYAPIATVSEGINRNGYKFTYVTCDHCEPWTTAVVKFINSVPR